MDVARERAYFKTLSIEKYYLDYLDYLNKKIYLNNYLIPKLFNIVILSSH